MKKQIFIFAFVITTCFGYVATAQVGVEFNDAVQPMWGPVGYDHVDYYFLPDIDAYYDVPHKQYVYFDNGTWVTRPDLPSAYADYNLYNGYKIVVNKPSPWLHNDKYQAKYERYKNRHDQKIIRDSHENKYRANPDHPEHSQWQQNNFQDGPHGEQR